MTVVRNFKLIGADQLAMLSEIVSQALDQWHAHWFVEPPKTNVSVVVVKPGVEAAGQDCWSIETELGKAYVQLNASDAVRLLTGWMIGNVNAKSAKVSAEWCLDFVLDLMKDALERMGAAEALSTVGRKASDLPVEFNQHASGAVLIQLDTAGEVIDMLLDANIVTGLLKKPGRASKPLRTTVNAERLSKALQSQPVALRAGSWLATELSIDAIRKLEIGDVVLLGRNIDQPWDVFTPNGDVIAKAYVGQQDAKRVVKVISAAKELNRNAN